MIIMIKNMKNIKIKMFNKHFNKVRIYPLNHDIMVHF